MPSLTALSSCEDQLGRGAVRPERRLHHRWSPAESRHGQVDIPHGLVSVDTQRWIITVRRIGLGNDRVESLGPWQLHVVQGASKGMMLL